LQYLHQLGELHLLPSIYGRISIPKVVADEILAGKSGGIDLPELLALDWIQVHRVEMNLEPQPRNIHRGEAKVIALALSIPQSLVILDDLAARKHAQLLGLAVTGTLGILVKAKAVGLIERLGPKLERLEKLGFRVSNETRLAILEVAGEE
jgi:predicted nucleic acid-binding protein